MSSHREQLIIQLLQLRGDLTAGKLEGVGGTGDMLPLMPHAANCRIRAQHLDGKLICTCWLQSLAEISHWLRKMRRHERRLWYHTHERYVAAERRPRLVAVKERRAQLEPNQTLIGLLQAKDLSKNGNGHTRVLVESWNPRVDQVLADRGVTWLAARFRGEPQLPTELLEAA